MLLYVSIQLVSQGILGNELLFTKKASAEITFTVPGGLIVPILTTGIIIWILSNLSKDEMIGSSIALLILSLIYVLIKWYKNKQIRLLAAKSAIK